MAGQRLRTGRTSQYLPDGPGSADHSASFLPTAGPAHGPGSFASSRKETEG